MVSIGTFDGVHRGHRALIERARERAASITTAGGDPVLVTALVFDPNPIQVLRPAHAPPRLTTFDQKRELLLAAGVDRVVQLEPTHSLLHETPQEFLTTLSREHGLVGIVEGPDFRFGRGRVGDIQTLTTLGPTLGFTVDIVEPVTVALNDHTIAPARSTMIRWLLDNGRVADAALVLGRTHTMRGVVRPGDRRGRTIGYPTANLDSPCMPPGDGVYAGRARLADGRTLVAAISVGTKPTFGDHGRAVEAFLFRTDSAGTPDWSPLPDLPEYGWTMDLEFIAWIREQVRFDTLDALLEQMARDCRRVEQLVGLRTARASVPPAIFTQSRPEALI